MPWQVPKGPRDPAREWIPSICSPATRRPQVSTQCSLTNGRMRGEGPTQLKDEGAVRNEANIADAAQSTETKLEARAIVHPRLFAEPREQSGRWRTVVLEADYRVRVRGRD